MNDVRTPSVLVRFLDAFLQERNIKWVLGAGLVILLGSSLLFVTTHWDTYTPLWKHLVLLGYVAAIHGAGQWSYHRLGLRKTGTVLQGLTVLLIPVLFLALQWMPRAAVAERVVHGVLLAGTFAFSLAAARRVFTHFLRGSQPTFLFSYLILALAGAILPGLPAAWAPFLALFLWAVFAAGTVKVNRHVFWLTEEHRAPRIFGFFPIALLGSQFVLLYFAFAAPHVSLDWLGFGLVLAAAPVLLTADTVARVFQQRTGDLVRPLPWSIVLPLGVGLLLCAAGVVLAGTNLVPPGRPHALVFAAAGAAALMGLVARRTKKQAFVWAMLLALTAAYNFSPVFFSDFVRTLAAEGAEAIREERLPYAFYGVSYLPLLLGLMAWSRRAAPSGRLFSEPLRWYVFALSCVLLAASLTHAKALLPVGLVMTAMFAFQARWFQVWYAMLPGIVAWLAAAAGLAPFVTRVLAIPLPHDSAVAALALGAAAQLAAGRRINGWAAQRMPASLASYADKVSQMASLVVALVLAAYWVAHAAMSPPAWPIGAIITGLLVLHSLRWQQPMLTGLTILFGQTVILVEMVRWGWTLPTIVSVATAALVAQWLLRHFKRGQGSLVSRTFGVADECVSSAGLTLLLIAVYLPLFISELLQPFVPAPAQMLILNVGWLPRVLIVLWGFAVAWRLSSRIYASAAYVALLALAGAAFLHVEGETMWRWVPTVWAAVGLGGLVFSELLLRLAPSPLPLSPAAGERGAGATEERLAGVRALEGPITYLTLGVFGLVAVGSLMAFALPFRVAGGIALIGLSAFSLLREQRSIRVPALILANWQVLGLVMFIFGPPLETVFELTLPGLLPICLPLAFCAALSLLLWQVFGVLSTDVDLPALQRSALRLVVVLAVPQTLQLAGLAGFDVLFAVGAFSFLFLAELAGACRNRSEAQVWLAGLVAVLGVAFLSYFRVVSLGRGLSMFVVLAVGIALWLVKEWASRRTSTLVLVRPFVIAAFVMPLVTVGLGVYRHLAATPVWLGANSLALLLAAGFYFWRGIENRRKWQLVLAGVILNIALVLLWRELTWTDPQFFMIPFGISVLALVQVLREEIPQKLHDPLRYLGALLILVSPTFHIVGGSWAHIFSLMVASVAILLLAIGLRVRALLYTGATFLVADLVAMLVRGSIDNANVLWIAGLALGAAILALGAFCERNREALLRRMALLAETLKTWR